MRAISIIPKMPQVTSMNHFFFFDVSLRHKNCLQKIPQTYEKKNAFSNIFVKLNHGFMIFSSSQKFLICIINFIPSCNYI